MSDEATTAGAGDFDNFRMYFSQFIIFTVWMVYAVPILGNLLDDKPLGWSSKLRTGWNYISGQRREAVKTKKTQ